MGNNSIRIIDLPKVEDNRGNLSFVEGGIHLPFDIKRAYWVYDVPGGQIRGSHAFKKNNELLIALSGSFDVVLDDGFAQQTFSLNRSYYGLYVPSMTWRTLENFSTNSLCLVLASEPYTTKDYIVDYHDFLIRVNQNQKA